MRDGEDRSPAEGRRCASTRGRGASGSVSGAVAAALLLTAMTARAQPSSAAAPPTSERQGPASDSPSPTPPEAPHVAPVAQVGGPAPVGAADSASVLRQANAAAAVGDWPAVEALVAPLVDRTLEVPDRAEVHRLRGLAAFFAQRLDLAEAELLAYLRLDLDAHLDPATVPPEAISYFESVQAKHRAELRTLRAARAPVRKSRWVALVPVAAQLQNGERGKAWLFGGSIVGLAALNVATYVTLRRWCDESTGTCDAGGVDRASAARTLSVVNWLSGIGAVVAAAVSMYDGYAGYRRTHTITPYVGVGASAAVGVSLRATF